MNSDFLDFEKIKFPEQELKHIVRLLVEAQEIAHIGIWQWTVKEPTVKWSSELYRIYGVTPQDYTPTYEDYIQKVHPEDRESVRETLKKAFTEYKSFSQDERVLRPDGSIRHLHTWGHAIVDEKGQLLQLIGVCQDITERKLAEEKLHKSEEKYRHIVESADDGIWCYDENQITTFVNQRMADILGYTINEIIGKNIFSFFNKSQLVLLQKHFTNYRHEHGSFDFPLRKKDGSRAWTIFAVSPLYDDRGKYSGTLAVVKDQTRRKHNETLLAAQKDIFDLLANGNSLARALAILVTTIETIVEGVIGSVLLLDDEGKHVLTGAAPNLPEDYSKAIHGAPIGPAAGSCGTSAFTGQLVITEDVRTDFRWANYLDLAEKFGLRACWSNPIFSLDGKVIGTFAMYFREVRRPSDSEIQLVLDATSAAALAIQHVRMREALTKAMEEREKIITQERNAKMEAQNSVQLRDDFISIASHELRTPLTPLKMQLQLMRQMLDSDLTNDPKILQKLTTFVADANSQLDSLQQLIDELINATRVSSEKPVLITEKCDLSETAKHVIDLHAAKIKKADCSLNLQLGVSVVGMWDRQQLETVIANLLSNAIKFGAGKPIDISVREENEMGILHVKDYGIGIAKEDHGRLFKRFERIVSLRRFGGLGMGLFIANEIVKAHGGFIEVESEFGKGAGFTVRLPLVLGAEGRKSGKTIAN